MFREPPCRSRPSGSAARSVPCQPFRRLGVPRESIRQPRPLRRAERLAMNPTERNLRRFPPNRRRRPAPLRSKHSPRRVLWCASALYIAAAVVFLPAIAIAAPFYLIYKLLQAYYETPMMRVAKARSSTGKLYEQARTIASAFPPSSTIGSLPAMAPASV